MKSRISDFLKARQGDQPRYLNFQLTGISRKLILSGLALHTLTQDKYNSRIAILGSPNTSIDCMEWSVPITKKKRKMVKGILGNWSVPGFPLQRATGYPTHRATK